MMERELEAWCRDYARKNGYLLLKLSPEYTPGLPDRLLIAPGGLLLIEFKRAGGVLSKLQRVLHRKINATTGENYLHVCDSKEKFLEILSTVSG